MSFAANIRGGDDTTEGHDEIKQEQEISIRDSERQPLANDERGNTDGDGISIGFVGFGTIASSIAEGLLTQDRRPVSQVYVSRRSNDKSSRLCRLFNDGDGNYDDERPSKARVVVCDDNSDIVRNSDIVFLCVLPQDADAVLRSLDFGVVSGVDDISDDDFVVKKNDGGSDGSWTGGKRLVSLVVSFLIVFRSTFVLRCEGCYIH